MQPTLTWIDLTAGDRDVLFLEPWHPSMERLSSSGSVESQLCGAEPYTAPRVPL